MKILFTAVIVLVLLVGAFFAFNSYIYNEKQADTDEATTTGTNAAPLELSGYFEERMVALGIDDIGHPIEGFDANLLIMAFPGLSASDFNGVETFEGHYEVEADQPVFIRDGSSEMITSAEGTVSSEGYATLLANVSARLSHPTYETVDVDELIERVNTGERVSAKLGESASVLGVTVTPLEVLEDSRCPIDVECIQAGKLRIQATLQSGLGTADQEFELFEPITTEGEEVTLIQAEPVPESTVTIDEGDYTFYFEIKKR